MSSVPVDARLTEIESTVAHLQHDFDQLHQATLALQTDVRMLQLAIQKLSARLEHLAQEPETRSPEQERPPHY